MPEIIIQYAWAVWDILLEASPYVLLGFFVAGLLKGFLPEDLVARHLGRGRILPVIKASLFGVPLPLCSCGVIPAAAGLRQQGASRGATTSFLISTPETGVDSIAVSYALLDPVMAVVRPVASFFTAIVAGVAVNFLPEERKAQAGSGLLPAPVVQAGGIGAAPAESACGIGCGCDSHSDAHAHLTPLQVHPETTDAQHSEATAHDHEHLAGLDSCGCSSDSCCSSSGPAPVTVMEKFTSGMRFGFGELVSDIGKWLMVGILLAAVITTIVPDTFFASYLGDGLMSMLVMLVLGLPLYVCATASTPVAAAMALKGLSPGAALVFLLAGPATNAATFTVVAKLMGKKVAAVYVASIAVCSVILGLFVNWLYAYLGLSITAWVGAAEEDSHGIIAVASAVVLVGLVVYRMFLSSKKLGPAHDHAHGCSCNH
ncbi:SO_0444 family Cu/Zn efflux transporter [Oleidesulfovibrio sp.]|uniref:SO_0444 family Cu/Zn efflux transporter n=1 Tax=Oleidesulfovibrio sp. TaxID=2909707 RepID=UPI003A87619D